MTLQQWLDDRRPLPPQRLRASMHDAVAASGQTENADFVEGSRVAALHLLNGILHDDQASRSVAVELLAADALMTYSCEAACEKPESLLQSSDDSIAALLTTYRAATDEQGRSH